MFQNFATSTTRPHDYAARRNFKKRKEEKTEEAVRVLIRKDFTGAFFILAFGIGASVIGIIVEILAYRFMAHKNSLIYFIL